MGGGNGAKAAMKRARNAKDAAKDPKSQLKTVSTPNPSQNIYICVFHDTACNMMALWPLAIRGPHFQHCLFLAGRSIMLDERAHRLLRVFVPSLDLGHLPTASLSPFILFPCLWPPLSRSIGGWTRTNISMFTERRSTKHQMQDLLPNVPKYHRTLSS